MKTKNFLNLKSWLLMMLMLIGAGGNLWAEDETITFSELSLENGKQYASIDGSSHGLNFSLTFGDGGNDGKYYTAGTAIRVYGGGHMIVTSSKNIKKIKLTFGSGDGSNTITTDVGTYSNGTWNGSATSVTFNVGGSSGHRRIASVAVTYESGSSGGEEPTIVTGYSIDFENELDAYTAWSFTKVSRFNDNNPVAHGGSYYAGNYNGSSGTTTAVIQTKEKVSNPESFTCWISKVTNNTTSSTWYIQVSSDGTNWTEVKSQSATSMTAKTWVKFSADLSSYSDVYVRLYYDGTSAIRCVDDITLTLRDESKQDVTLSFPETTYEATMGSEFNVPTLTATANEQEVTGLSITYSSSNTNVATVDASSGAVTLVAAGETVITATFAGNDEYNGASASYTLNVAKDPNANDGSAEKPYTVAEARAVIDAGTGLTGVYVKGIVSGIVTEYSSQYGNISYNISADGSTTADQLQAYRGKSYNGDNFTSQNNIEVGDLVIISGNLKKYGSTYELDANNKLISNDHADAVFSFGDETEFEVALNKPFTAPALSKGVYDGTVTYASSDTDVATVADDGKVTLVGLGTTTITASGARTSAFHTPTPASYTLTVVDAVWNVEAQASEGGSVSIDGKVITATPAEGYRISKTNPYNVNGTAEVAQEGNVFTVAPTSDCTVTINFEKIPEHNVVWSINGVEETTTALEDAAVEFPAAPEAIEGKTFVGWVAEAIDGETDEAPTFVTSATMATSDLKYYAVFADGDVVETNTLYKLNYDTETALSSSTEWGSYGTSYTYTAADGGVWVVKAYKNKGMQINTGKNASIKIPECAGYITSIEITGSTEKAVGLSASDYSGSGTITYIAEGTDATTQTLDLTGKNVTTGYIVPKSGNIVLTKIVVYYTKKEGSFTNYCTTVDVPIVISTVEELKTFRDAVNNGTSFAGKTVKLAADIDLSGEENWTPIGNLVAYPTQSFNGVFDGDGHKISNVTVVDNTPNHAVAGLFGSIVNGTIKNLTVENVNLTSSHYAAGIVAYTSNGPTIENCHVIGGTITSVPELLNGSYDNGDKVGGIMGYATAGSTINNCTVEGLTIKGYRDMGGIAGFSAGTVTNNTVKNTTIIQSDVNAYKNEEITTYDYIVGRNGGATLENNVYEELNNVLTIDGAVAKIGDKLYRKLQAAFNAAEAGETVTLLKDYDAKNEAMAGGTRQFVINKSITFDGGGYTLTTKQRGIGIGNVNGDVTANIDVTIKNVTVLNTSDAARCVDTRGKIGSLTLNGVTLNTQGATGTTQPLTIGGNQSEAATVTITNSTIQTNDEGTAYYAITTFNPVNMTISGSTVKGWACIYAKGANSSAGSAGSVFTVKDNSTLVSKNVYSGDSNAFAAIMIEDDNVTVNIEDAEVNVSATGDQNQGVASYTEDTSSSSVFIKEGSIVNLTGENAVVAFDTANDGFANCGGVAISGGTFNKPVKDVYCAEGFIPTDLGEGKYSVKEGQYVAQVGEQKYETFAEAVTAAENNTITLLADVEDAYTLAAGQMLNVIKGEYNLTVNAPEGFILKTTEAEGITTYSYAVPVAQIGDDVYASLADAVAAATDGQTITLLADDNSLADGSEIEINKSLTITGAVADNGEPLYTIFGKADQTGTNDIFITGAGTVTLSNLKVKNFGNDANTDAAHAPIYVSKNFTGTVNLTNVYVSDFNRGGIFLYGGTFNVEDCYIDCANAKTGAFTKGIEIKGSANGTIKSTLICNMERSSTTYSSAGIEIYGNGTVIVDDCTIISDNDHESVKATYGIVISRVGEYDPSGGSLQVKSSMFDCTNACLSVVDSDVYGPVSNYSIIVDDCNFTNYIATWSATSSITINSGSYSEDVYADAGTIIINDGEFSNFAPTTGDSGSIVIYGGTFDADPSAYVADGYVAVQDSETELYTVTQLKVAQIGDVTYPSLAAAIAAVPENGTEATTITMIADEEFASDATMTVEAGKNIVLDLNGKTVSGISGVTKSFYFITNNGTLEITDNSENASGKITYKSASVESSYSKEFVTVYNLGGTLTLTKGTVENTSGGGLAYAINTSSNAWGSDVVSTFNMNGGTVSAPSGDAALRVYQNCAAGTVQSKNYVNIAGGTIAATGIFVDETLYNNNIPADYAGANIDTKINISGGSVVGLIDMKIRHPFNTLLNITGGDFSGTKMWVRKADGYVTSCGEPTAPMVSISGGKFDFAGENAFGLASNYGATTWTSYDKPYAISGGVFDLAVPEEYCAEGYLPAGNTDAATSDAYPYTVSERPKVAQIGDVQYYSLADAVAAVPADGTETTITMIDNEAIASGITIPAGKNIILELNGKVVSYNSPSGNTQALITNRGTLVIQDNTDTDLNGTGTGLIGADYTNPDTGEIPGYASNTITNGGTLTIKSGKIINTATKGAACYVIDNNSTTNNAILNIEGGYIYRERSQAVRLFCNSTTYQNAINISGGIVEGGYAGFWIQLPGDSGQKKLATVNITGGELKGGTYAWYDYSFGDSFEAVNYSVSGGKFNGDIYSFAVADGVKPGFITGGLFASTTIEEDGETYDCDWPRLLAEGLACTANTDETTKDEYPYAVGEAEIIYSWVENGTEYKEYHLFATPFVNNYLMDGESITLLKNVTLTEDIACQLAEGSFNLNLGDYTITKGDYSVSLKPNVSVLTDKQTDIYSAAEAGYMIEEAEVEGGYSYTAVKVEVAAPIVFHDGGTYEEALTVPMIAQAGAEIYYSTDGESYTKYTQPIEISATTTVTAYAMLLGAKSAEVTKTFEIVAKQVGPSVTDSYYNIKAGNKFVNVAGRKTVTLVDNTEGMPGTVIRVKATDGKVETLRSQGVDVPGYAQKAMNYVPEIVRLAVDKLHAVGAGELLGEHGMDAIMTKFNESFDYNLYLEKVGETEAYRIYGRTPSMKPVVDFYAENKDNVDAKLPQLEQFINQAIDKVLEKTGGRGAGILVDFDLETVWQNMGGTLTKPVDEASTAKFYEEVLTSEANVWNFAYQTAMIYWGNLKNNDTFKNNLDKLGDYAKYIDKVENIQPNFKYYIVPSESGVDFISEGNIAIINNAATAAWTMEAASEFTVEIPEANKVGDKYYTTLYTDFAYTLPEGVKAMKVTSIEESGCFGYAVTEEIDAQSIAEQTPILLVSETAGSQTLTLSKTGTAVTDNLLKGADYLISEYKIKTSQIESLFDIAKSVLGEDGYQEYLEQYEHLMLRNAGTVNNKYFFGLSKDDCKEVDVNVCVLENVDEFGTIFANDKESIIANKAFLVNDIYTEIRLTEVGDVNRDGQISIADVTALVNIILGKDNTEPYQYDHSAADVNCDGGISIADVTALVNIILGKPNN